MSVPMPQGLRLLGTAVHGTLVVVPCSCPIQRTFGQTAGGVVAPPRATQRNFGPARLTVSPEEGSTTRCAIATSPSPVSQAPERHSCRLWYAEAGRAGPDCTRSRPLRSIHSSATLARCTFSRAIRLASFRSSPDPGPGRPDSLIRGIPGTVRKFRTLVAEVFCELPDHAL